MGDTNCDLSSTQSPLESPNSDVPTFTKHILDIYNSFELKQLITEPTRETLDTATIIDHVAISNPSNVVESDL